jgi:hypothetical protein
MATNNATTPPAMVTPAPRHRISPQCAANGLPGKQAAQQCGLKVGACPACIAHYAANLQGGSAPPATPMPTPSAPAATPVVLTPATVPTVQLQPATVQPPSNNPAAVASTTPPATQPVSGTWGSIVATPTVQQPPATPATPTVPGVFAPCNAQQLAAHWQAYRGPGGQWVGLMVCILQHCLPHGVAYSSAQLCAASYSLLVPKKVQQTYWRGAAAGNQLPAGCWGSLNPTQYGYNMPGTATANIAPVRVGSRGKAQHIAAVLGGNTPTATVQPPVAATATQAQLAALATAYPQQLATLLPWALAQPQQLATLLALAQPLQAHLASNPAVLAQLVQLPNVLGVLAQLPTSSQTVPVLASLLPAQTNTPA